MPKRKPKSKLRYSQDMHSKSKDPIVHPKLKIRTLQLEIPEIGQLGSQLNFPNWDSRGTEIGCVGNSKEKAFSKVNGGKYERETQNGVCRGSN